MLKASRSVIKETERERREMQKSALIHFASLLPIVPLDASSNEKGRPSMYNIKIFILVRLLLLRLLQKESSTYNISYLAYI